MDKLDSIYLSLSSFLIAIIVGISWINASSVANALIIILLVPQFFMNVYSTFFKDKILGPNFEIVEGVVRYQNDSIIENGEIKKITDDVQRKYMGKIIGNKGYNYLLFSFSLIFLDVFLKLINAEYLHWINSIV